MQREPVLITPPTAWNQRFLDAAARLDTSVTGYASSWPAAYLEAAEPERAARDAALLASLTRQQTALVVETRDRQPDFWRVSLYVLDRPVSLTEVLPGLQSLGLEVLDEQPFAVTRPDGVPCWIYDFRVQPPENAAARAADVQQRVQDALSAIWEGYTETDPFNGLVVSSGLTWEEAALLRAYYGYLRQVGFPLGRAYVASVLMDHPSVVQTLMGLFTARFDPAGDRASSAVRAADLAADATARIDDIESLDAGRVLRAYLALILGTVRTNYYRDSPAGDSVASALALKLHPEELAELPMPRSPDPATSFAERARLFKLPRSSWADYNPELISEGGGVFARTLKSVPVSAQVRAALDLPDSTTSLAPAALIRAVLTAPVDLLWNGGIGTYVKSSSESHPNAGDRSNDSVRVDAAGVRARVVGEGGNLGFTPRGRIEYARHGGRINTDALDNSAGVACSDLEVNIKIVLNALLDRGELTSAARAALLSSMTPQVSSLVLAENVNQNELLGVARRTASDSLSVHRRLLTRLEQTRGLDRELLSLPGDAAIRRLAQTGDGLTSPELATLIAQVKLALKADLLAGPLPAADVLIDRLLGSFPQVLVDAYSGTVIGHPLRREIVATSVANEVVDFGGIAFVHRLHEDEAADATDAVRAFLIAVEVFDLRTVWARIRDAGLPASISDELIIESTRVLARATRWLLRSRPQPLDVGREIGHFAAVRELGARVPGWLRGEDRDALEERLQHVLQVGAPRELALAVHGLLDRFCLLDIAEISAITGFPAPTVAQQYYVLKDRYRINRLLNAVSRLEHEDRWSALARLGLRNDLYSAVRTLCIDVLAVCGPEVTADEAIARWEEANRPRLMRAAATLEETAETTERSLATLSVAVRQINGLVSHSAPIPT